MVGRGAHANPGDHVFFFFQCEPKYSMGVVLVLTGEGASLGRLGVEVQTKATPRPEAGDMIATCSWLYFLSGTCSYVCEVSCCRYLTLPFLRGCLVLTLLLPKPVIL